MFRIEDYVCGKKACGIIRNIQNHIIGSAYFGITPFIFRSVL